LRITEGEEKIPSNVEEMLQKRQEMRSSADFKKDNELQKLSDELRDKIQAAGWLLKDGRPGEPSTVKKKRRTWD
jgi:cysteinyl-tRNA synthetase